MNDSDSKIKDGIEIIVISEEKKLKQINYFKVIDLNPNVVAYYAN
ncbi:765_t:CDS:2 [Entrophospora sp. SA101]|nr:765_t:CDS:2 [Entrophospora sp. SA101]